MENRINIAELLKDCPTGMELDCVMCDNVILKDVDFNSKYPIRITHQAGEDTYTYALTEHGYWRDTPDGKCLIFPKGKNTWEEFVPPHKYKNGDIVITTLGNIAIVKEFISSTRCSAHYVLVCGRLITDDTIGVIRFAKESEKAELFKAIKDNGYKWNSETKTLEKLPKFKVGDRIQNKYNGKQFTITKIYQDCYECGDRYVLTFENQDIWESVSGKFDITTLVPFESRVLVRNSKDQYWIPAFWGFRAKDGYVTTFGHCNYCIPFMGNEHLLDTTDDCDEYYKTWE